MRFVITILTILLFSGCYTEKKATVQHGKAVTTYPKIGADYCARIYPPKDSIIKGDSILLFDTLYVGGDVVFDTITLKDTVKITKTVTQPAQVIIKKIIVHDTVVRVSTAALDLCAIERWKAIENANAEIKRADKWEKKAKQRFWIMLSLIFIIVGYVGARVYQKTKIKSP